MLSTVKNKLSYLSRFGLKLDCFANHYEAQGFGDSLYIKDPEANVIELKYQRQ